MEDVVKQSVYVEVADRVQGNHNDQSHTEQHFLLDRDRMGGKISILFWYLEEGKKMMIDRPIVVVPPEEPALPGYRAEKALVNYLWTLTDIDLTYLRRVTSWEAPNIATPLREASKGKGIDWKSDQVWKDQSHDYLVPTLRSPFFLV